MCLWIELFIGKFSLSLFFSSLATPQFGLLHHLNSLRLSSGHSGLGLTLNMQPTPFCSAHASWWQMRASGLLLRWELRLGAYSVFFSFFPPSFRLCCSLRFQNSPRTSWWEDYLVFGNFSFTTPSPGQVSIPNSFVSLLSFIFCPTSFGREWAAFLGAWCPLPGFRNCFVEVAQHSNDLLMNLWRRKWFPCPVPPPS